MKQVRLSVGFLAVSLLPVLCGCYTYSAVEGDSPPAGTEVRVRLTAPGARALAERSDHSFGSRLQGRLVGTTGDSTTVRVARSVNQPALGGRTTQSEVSYIRLSVPNSQVRAIERRNFSYLKTGALVAAGGVALRLFLELPEVIGDGGSGPMDQPPPPSPVRIENR